MCPYKDGIHLLHHRLKLSEEAIKKDVPSANIRPLTIDLSSLEAVRRAAIEVNAYPELIHARPMVLVLESLDADRLPSIGLDQ